MGRWANHTYQQSHNQQITRNNQNFTAWLYESCARSSECKDDDLPKNEHCNYSLETGAGDESEE